MIRIIFIIFLSVTLSGQSVFSQTETRTMTKKEILDAGGINIYFPNFDFDTRVKVISYEVSAYIINGDFTFVVRGTTRFSKDIRNLIKDMRKNERLYIENIKVKLEDGTIRTLNPITVKIRF